MSGMSSLVGVDVFWVLVIDGCWLVRLRSWLTMGLEGTPVGWCSTSGLGGGMSGEGVSDLSRVVDWIEWCGVYGVGVRGQGFWMRSTLSCGGGGSVDLVDLRGWGWGALVLVEWCLF